MGLFRSSYETTVATQVSRVIEDDLLPNSVKRGGMRAILKSQDIVESVFSEMANSIAMKAERMFDYAKNTYVHGLPSGQFAAAMDGQAAVTAVLESIYGNDVTLTYSHFSPPNMQHIGWTRLIENHGYNPVTNRLMNLSAAMDEEVYLSDMVLVIPAAQFDEYAKSALEQWGEPARAGASPGRAAPDPFGLFRQHTPPERSLSATTAHIRIDYVWEVPTSTPVAEGFEQTKELMSDSFTIYVDGFDNTVDYFHVRFLDGSIPRYWMYRSGSGTYPSLDVVFDKTPSTSGTFFPFGYFRFNKVSETSNKSSTSYRHNKKLMKYLGIDFDTVADAINENPDIANVEQAMLVMAVPANTTDPLELRYLFKFFDNVYSSSGNQYNTPVQLSIAQYQAEEMDITRTSVVIQDKRFKMALSNAGVTKKRVAGSIGPVGTHAMTTETFYLTKTYYDPPSETNKEMQVPFKKHIYRKQVSFQIFEEIEVANLKMRYHIWNEYSVTADEDDDILLVPIDRSISEHWSIPERETLFARSLHYVFNSRVVTEIKWYQSTFFTFIIKFVTLVMTFVGMPPGIAQALQAGTAAAIGTAIMAFIQEMVINMAIGAVLKAVAKALGLEAVVILAALAFVIGKLGDFMGGPGLNGLPGAPWADKLVQLATGLMKASSGLLQDMYQELADEFNALQQQSIEAEKEFERANSLLENHNLMIPVVVFGESPDDFYYRTVHSGNIGVLSIQCVSSYVDIALKLPELVETIHDKQFESTSRP